MTDRNEYIKGLRQLADLLEDNTGVPLPYEGDGTAIGWSDYSNDARAEVARLARLLPGKLVKNDPKSSPYADQYYQLAGTLGGNDGLKVDITAYRSSVCEAVTTNETVTVTERDPVAVEAALGAIPEVETTKVVKKVEWICSPLLEEAVSA